MIIETIDGVQYYVWRAGDELPKYQPIWLELCVTINHTDKEWQTDVSKPEHWLDCPRRWHKLLNDRAQHQRMIDEALVEFADRRSVQTFDVSVNMDEGVRLIESGEDKQKGLMYLAGAGAHILRLMEWAQEQIDKEGEKV